MRALVCIWLVAFAQFSFAWGDKPYNAAYDPFRNPFIDFESAKQDAAKSGKLILIEFGGDWCIWCMRLDKFITTNQSLKQHLDAVFVVLKVNVSEEKSNLDFSKQFPQITGYPHFIITNHKGEVLGVQDTSKLEQGESYSLVKMEEFISRWKRKPVGP